MEMAYVNIEHDNKLIELQSLLLRKNNFMYRDYATR